jgi:metal-sulfur cluster biosynthetic enzyme
MAMPTPEEVMRALKAVFDPEIGINIVDLGLVYGTTVEDSTINIEMTLTSPACPLAPVIEAQAEAILTSNFEDVDDVKVHYVWKPPWDPRTMASEDAKLELGIW